MSMNRTTLATAEDNFEDLPTSDTKTRRLGFGIIFVVFGIFGTWAAVAPLDSAANAPGVVTVKTYRKTVQHLEGGIVKELRSEEHTSELQSHHDLVCRLL